MSFQKKKIRKINWQKKKNVFLKCFKKTLVIIAKDILKISKKIPSSSASKVKKKISFSLIIGLFLALAFFYGSFKVLTLASSFSPKEIVLSLFSQKIKTDERDHTNFLIVGVGGENHDGGNLTDSIKIISIDHKNKYISMMSIPRDLWVYTEEYYGHKINEVYALKETETGSEELGMLYLSQEITELTGIDIHYQVKIDFKSFEQVVDSLGCININIPEELIDPKYPDNNYGYQTFHIKAGQQCIDGATALKYARSRYSTLGGDFSRSQRQTLLIKAIKEEALSAGVLLNPKKLKDLYDSFSDNVYTNLSWDEMVYLAKISSKFSSDKIVSAVVNDVPHETAGFLYAPPRENYGGAVFRPSYCAYQINCNNPESFYEIHQFVDFFMYQTELYLSQKTFRILNGTKAAGLAGDLLLAFSRYGLDVTRYGNALNREEPLTTIYIRAEYNEKGEIINQEQLSEDPILKILRILLPNDFEVKFTAGSDYDSSIFENDSDYIIVLGEDFESYRQENSELFYYWN